MQKFGYFVETEEVTWNQCDQRILPDGDLCETNPPFQRHYSNLWRSALAQKLWTFGRSLARASVWVNWPA